MHSIQRRALYNLLRMNWLNDPNLPVEKWQVEDYRALPLPVLLDRLTAFDIHFDRISYVAYADTCDSPEELTERLLADRPPEAAYGDQAYLLLFELWRRLVSEKPSISVLCDELDHQIFLYSREEERNLLVLQDTLAQFIQLLDENVDQGIQPEEAFELITHYFANELEVFLYDFTADQMDEGNESYAHELLEDFHPYLGGNKWFKLLCVRGWETIQGKRPEKIIGEILEECLNGHDLNYHLELLSVAAEKEDRATFLLVMRDVLPLIVCEEDLQDLFALAIDYFHRQDRDQEEIILKRILEKRGSRPLDRPVEATDPDLEALSSLFESKGANAS